MPIEIDDEVRLISDDFFLVGLSDANTGRVTLVDHLGYNFLVELKDGRKTWAMESELIPLTPPAPIPEPIPEPEPEPEQPLGQPRKLKGWEKVKRFFRNIFGG